MCKYYYVPGNCYNGYLLLIVRNVGKPVENADSYLHRLVFRRDSILLRSRKMQSGEVQEYYYFYGQALKKYVCGDESRDFEGDVD